MSVRVELNFVNIGKLLRGPEVQADLLRRARNIARKAGSGMEPSVQVGRRRAHGSVITATDAARKREATQRALTRAIDAGRL